MEDTTHDSFMYSDLFSEGEEGPTHLILLSINGGAMRHFQMQKDYSPMAFIGCNHDWVLWHRAAFDYS